MLLRRSLFAVIAILPLALVTRPSAAIEAGQAGAFIQTLGDEAITTLGKSHLDEAAREKEFRRLLKAGFAIHGIGRFVLGRYWRGASDGQRSRYLQAFEDYIVATYAARFEQYDGQTFKVNGERPDGDDGRIVESEVRPKDRPVIVVQWRVRQGSEGLKIVDILVEGVSMAVTQRSEFSAVMGSNGGNLDALIEQLEAKSAALR